MIAHPPHVARRALSSQLVGGDGGDTEVIASVIAELAFVALASCVLHAWGTGRTPPMIALRSS